jgi:hypothetical protein
MPRLLSKHRGKIAHRQTRETGVGHKCSGKGKVVPVLELSTTPWRRIGEWRYSSTHSLTSALGGGEWSASRPDRFTPRERAPVTHWIGSWVGPRAVLDAVVKRKIPSPRRESNPRISIVQPVTKHNIKNLYTNTSAYLIVINGSFQHN